MKILKYAQSDPDSPAEPIIVITALIPYEVSVVADAMFHKPLDYPALLTTVRGLMQSRS